MTVAVLFIEYILVRRGHDTPEDGENPTISKLLAGCSAAFPIRGDAAGQRLAPSGVDPLCGDAFPCFVWLDFTVRFPVFWPGACLQWGAVA